MVPQFSGRPTMSGSSPSTTIRAFGTCGSGRSSISSCNCSRVATPRMPARRRVHGGGPHTGLEPDHPMAPPHRMPAWRHTRRHTPPNKAPCGDRRQQGFTKGLAVGHPPKKAPEFQPPAGVTISRARSGRSCRRRGSTRGRRAIGTGRAKDSRVVRVCPGRRSPSVDACEGRSSWGMISAK